MFTYEVIKCTPCMLDRTGTNFSNLNYIFWPWFNHIHTYKHCFLLETHTLSHPFHNKNKGEKNELFPSIKTNAWLIESNFVYFSIDQIIFFSSSHNVQQIKTQLFKSGNNSVSFLNVVEAGAPLDISNVFILPLLSSSDLFDPHGMEVCSRFRRMTPKL